MSLSGFSQQLQGCAGQGSNCCPAAAVVLGSIEGQQSSTMEWNGGAWPSDSLLCSEWDRSWFGAWWGWYGCPGNTGDPFVLPGCVSRSIPKYSWAQCCLSVQGIPWASKSNPKSTFQMWGSVYLSQTLSGFPYAKSVLHKDMAEEGCGQHWALKLCTVEMQRLLCGVLYFLGGSGFLFICF